MKNKLFLLILFLLVSLLAFLNFYAGQYFWYWKFWWFDLIMHFSGGVSIALLVFYLHKIFELKEKININSLIFFITITIAILWEIMEFLIDANLFGGNYFFDTLTDVFIALIGALIVSSLSNKIKIEIYKEENVV